MSSTIETLERELGEAQEEREAEQRAVVRAENAHEAACSARDEAWSEGSATDPEVEELTDLVYLRRRELYDAIDRLKAAEGKERRIKSRLMYVLPAERRRYLSGTVDEEFEGLLEAVREAYRGLFARRAGLRGNGEDRARWTCGETRRGGRWSGCTRAPCAGGSRSGARATPPRRAGWRARSPTTRGAIPRALSWAARRSGPAPSVARGSSGRSPATRARRDGCRSRASPRRRYLDESSVARLGKRPQSLVQVAEIARLYQTMNLTVDEIRWRLEQLISLRFEVLEAVYRLTGERRRFSFYEIARAARLLDGHFPDSGVAAEVLSQCVRQALTTGVPLVDVAYMNVTTGEGF